MKLIYGLYFLIFIAVTGDFIANEKPIFIEVDGQSYFPIWSDRLPPTLKSRRDQTWEDLPYSKIIRPPIPYSYHTIDRDNMGYKSPFGPQNVTSPRYWHWMGTDGLGRDIAAGIISGTRTALLVGLIAMGIAALIGIFLGAIAGYYGNEGWEAQRGISIMVTIGVVFAFLTGFYSRRYWILQESSTANWLISWLIFTGIVLLFAGIGLLINRISFFSKKIAIPLDTLILRLIEIVNSIPTLLLLLSLLAIINQPSLLTIMGIIGCLAWTGIARFTRAEFLRIKNLPYIDAARNLGFSDFRIMFKHILPNASTPIMVSLSFGIAGAVLLEAFLSFLGIGIPPEKVTWGSMLNSARNYFPAWWMAIFPGGMIFFTVLLFNLLGEKLKS
jgi:peptide/nickel transport system permease protein